MYVLLWIFSLQNFDNCTSMHPTGHKKLHIITCCWGKFAVTASDHVYILHKFVVVLPLNLRNVDLIVLLPLVSVDMKCAIASMVFSVAFIIFVGFFFSNIWSAPCTRVGAAARLTVLSVLFTMGNGKRKAIISSVVI
jgi:hypothetical protein